MSELSAPPGDVKKPRRSLVWLILAGLAVIVIYAARGPDTTGGGGGNLVGRYRVVTYQVTGQSRRADVTYENKNADTSQESEVSVPWSYSFTAEPGAFVYISAQRGGGPGDIICTIRVNGQTVETNTSSGPYTICTASGIL